MIHSQSGGTVPYPSPNHSGRPEVLLPYLHRRPVALHLPSLYSNNARQCYSVPISPAGYKTNGPPLYSPDGHIQVLGRPGAVPFMDSSTPTSLQYSSPSRSGFRHGSTFSGRQVGIPHAQATGPGSPFAMGPYRSGNPSLYRQLIPSRSPTCPLLMHGFHPTTTYPLPTIPDNSPHFMDDRRSVSAGSVCESPESAFPIDVRRVSICEDISFSKKSGIVPVQLQTMSNCKGKLVNRIDIQTVSKLASESRTPGAGCYTQFAAAKQTASSLPSAIGAPTDAAAKLARDLVQNSSHIAEAAYPHASDDKQGMRRQIAPARISLPSNIPPSLREVSIYQLFPSSVTSPGGCSGDMTFETELHLEHVGNSPSDKSLDGSPSTAGIGDETEPHVPNTMFEAVAPLKTATNSPRVVCAAALRALRGLPERSLSDYDRQFSSSNPNSLPQRGRGANSFEAALNGINNRNEHIATNADILPETPEPVGRFSLDSRQQGTLLDGPTAALTRENKVRMNSTANMGDSERLRKKPSRGGKGSEIVRPCIREVSDRIGIDTSMEDWVEAPKTALLNGSEMEQCWNKDKRTDCLESSLRRNSLEAGVVSAKPVRLPDTSSDINVGNLSEHEQDRDLAVSGETAVDPQNASLPLMPMVVDTDCRSAIVLQRWFRRYLVTRTVKMRLKRVRIFLSGVQLIQRWWRKTLACRYSSAYSDYGNLRGSSYSFQRFSSESPSCASDIIFSSSCVRRNLNCSMDDDIYKSSRSETSRVEPLISATGVWACSPGPRVLPPDQQILPTIVRRLVLRGALNISLPDSETEEGAFPHSDVSPGKTKEVHTFLKRRLQKVAHQDPVDLSKVKSRLSESGIIESKSAAKSLSERSNSEIRAPRKSKDQSVKSSRLGLTKQSVPTRRSSIELGRTNKNAAEVINSTKSTPIGTRIQEQKSSVPERAGYRTKASTRAPVVSATSQECKRASLSRSSSVVDTPIIPPGSTKTPDIQLKSPGIPTKIPSLQGSGPTTASSMSRLSSSLLVPPRAASHSKGPSSLHQGDNPLSKARPSTRLVKEKTSSTGVSQKQECGVKTAVDIGSLTPIEALGGTPMKADMLVPIPKNNLPERPNTNDES